MNPLQERIPVRTAAGMAERLETVGRKIGLKFMGAPVHGCYYLSTEMFYVEINIDAAGNVNEAKIHHIVAPGADGSSASASSKHPTTQNCPEIIGKRLNADLGLSFRERKIYSPCFCFFIEKDATVFTLRLSPNRVPFEGRLLRVCGPPRGPRRRLQPRRRGLSARQVSRVAGLVLRRAGPPDGLQQGGSSIGC